MEFSLAVEAVPPSFPSHFLPNSLSSSSLCCSGTQSQALSSPSLRQSSSKCSIHCTLRKEELGVKLPCGREEGRYSASPIIPEKRRERCGRCKSGRSSLLNLLSPPPPLLIRFSLQYHEGRSEHAFGPTVAMDCPTCTCGRPRLRRSFPRRRKRATYVRTYRGAPNSLFLLSFPLFPPLSSLPPPPPRALTLSVSPSPLPLLRMG